MPTGAQRRAIAQRVTDLRRLSEPGPVAATISTLGELIQEYAPSRLDAETVSIKAEAYLDAVEDLPAWAVREAVRRWRRGDVSGDLQDLNFAPRPARLRRIASTIALAASGQALRLQRVLDAEPEEERSDEERAAISRRIAAEINEVARRAPSEPPRGPSRPAKSEEAVRDEIAYWRNWTLENATAAAGASHDAA